MSRRLTQIVTVAALLVGRTAAAQIGHTPETSPFEDIAYRQSFSTFAGWYKGDHDPAGVAPRSGPIVGAQYDIYLAGPASFTARIATAITERTVIDPARPLSRRVLGDEQRPLMMADVGFSFAMTGQKSWHGLVPLAHTGLGLASNLKGSDPGGFSLGTRFALAYGAGVRYVPNGRLAVRADLGWRLYQIRYPDRYFEIALDSTSVMVSTASKSAWLNNPSATLGVTYQLFR